MPVKIFLCYAEQDKMFVTRLKGSLLLLQRTGLVNAWHDYSISDMELEPELSQHLDTANIILLIVSADLLSSDFCSGKEMMHAIERHKHGEAQVIPIIFRPSSWKESPLRELRALPTGGKPANEWYNFDLVISNITEGVFKVIEELAH